MTTIVQEVRPAVRLCLDCNYSLQALTSNRCPECGRTFDPDDRSTFNCEGPLNWFDRLLLAPIGVPTFSLAGLLCAGLLWISLYPAIYYMGIYFILTCVVWAVAFGSSAARFFLGAMLVPPSIPRRPDRRVRYMFALLLVTSLLVIFCVPLRIAFLLARPGLDNLVTEIHEGKTTLPVTGRRVGPFVVSSSVNYGRDDTLFFDLGNQRGGFAYCPNDGPRGHYNDGADGHLFGPWYWWIDD